MLLMRGREAQALQNCVHAGMRALVSHVTPLLFPTAADDATVVVAKAVPTVAQAAAFVVGGDTMDMAGGIAPMLLSLAELQHFSRAVYESFSQPVTHM